MRIILFGTGDYYKKYRKWFRDEDVTALLDNDMYKRGKVLNGTKVYLPQSIQILDYDWIIILSVSANAMKNQLIELGVSEGKILKYSDLHTHSELIKSDVYSGVYANNVVTCENIKNLASDKAILFMSHNLDMNGATLALFYAAICTKKYGYDIVFASWNDGELRNYLEAESIPIIIDPNLEIRTADEIDWVKFFKRAVCNTLNYYQFLAKRDDSNRYVWWLHDPDFFYQTIDRELLKQIDFEKVNVYAAGQPAVDAIQNYLPELKVKTLFYGVPDVVRSEKDIQGGQEQMLEAAVIANIQDYKGQDILIDALQYLSPEDCKSLHIRIIGNADSAFARVLKDKVEKEKLSEYIEFVPFMNRTELNKLFEEIELLICPSRQDVMPVSVCEAMQYEIPSIISDSVGTARTINNGKNGIIFKSGNPEELAKRIRWCIHNRGQLRIIGKKARKIYKKYFSICAFNKNWREVLSECFGL